MSQVVFTKMLGRFMAVYGKPNSPDEEGFYAEYAKALSNWSAEFLDKAADLIIKEHTSPFWPTVGECTAMLRRVAAAEAAKSPRPRAWDEIDRMDPDRKPDPEMAAKIQAIFDEFCKWTVVDTVSSGGFDVDVSRNGFAQRAAEGKTRFAP